MKIGKVNVINDADYIVNPRYGVSCPYYYRWRDMIRRCYDEKYQIQQPSYKDCYVCEEWLTFSNFKNWMEQQNWQGKQLDKDILCRGNREYGPRTCIFVKNNINSLICENKHQRGKYPMGVHFRYGKYTASIKKNGKKKHIGSYNTEKEASDAYCKEKSKHILEIANNLTLEHTSDIKLTKKAFIKYARLLLIGTGKKFQH